ncbi:MAG TPA: arginine--tRNA ligase [Deltaproteobacteria bacterium]|nr:arginine--tRNA ligase [Deltaproteobacteria bacterium]
MKEKLEILLLQAVLKAYPNSISSLQEEVPADSKHGDFASNVAMVLTKALKKNPREIAQTIKDNIDLSDGMIGSVVIEGPGFLNFKLTQGFWIRALKIIDEQKKMFGVCQAYKGKKAMVEFVSANPTGPLHIGHGRNAVVGDTIARLLSAVGYEVTREYYVNDGGIQISTLGRSVYARYLQKQGVEVPFPEDGYQGDYIADIAAELLPRSAEFERMPRDQIIETFGRYAGDKILGEILEDLRRVGVQFDSIFQESSLYKQDKVRQTIDELKAKNLVYEQEGALWLRSTSFGDDKDRVLIKSDGSYTYLSPDIAYHRDKFKRGFDLLVNVWGADHAGYGPRLKAALLGLGYPADHLHLVFIQMVSLIREGETVSMSTRRATYETLEDVVKAVGKDVARYFFMMRSYQAQLEFDMELAKKETSENPVYYIQYAHARICSIFEKALEEQKIAVPAYKDEWSALLGLPEETEMAQLLLEYPESILKAASEITPHRVAHYALELARAFQSYYDKARSDDRYRVVGHDKKTTQAKLFFLSCVRQVLQNAMHVLGIEAPEKM